MPAAAALARALIWVAPPATALVLWLAFPPVGWGAAAWVALVPLGLLLRVPGRGVSLYLSAWLGGLVFGLLAVQWLRYADDTGLTGYYGWFALALYLSLYFPCFVAAGRAAVRGLRMPTMVAVPIVWVGLEYLRGWFQTGFPWYFLGHTQYRATVLVQVADLAGTYGVSFLVALVNGCLIGLVPLPSAESRPLRRVRTVLGPPALAALALGAALAYGSVRLSAARLESGPRVALIQTNVPQTVKIDDNQTPVIHRQYLRLLDRAVAQKPDLVIWPETAYRYPLVRIAPDVRDEDLARLFAGGAEPDDVRSLAFHVRRDLARWAEHAGVPMLMGLNAEEIEPGRRRMYNAAVLITPDGDFRARYDKRVLVPWGEYLPLAGWLPWLHVFTPNASADYGLVPGSEWVRFRLGGTSFGVLICFEDTVPGAARAYMGDPPVDMLVNVSNDGWFGDSSELDAHLAISVFRAIECRRPVVRAVNTGLRASGPPRRASAVIDSNGRFVAIAGSAYSAPAAAADVVVADVPLDRRRSLYVVLGDWLGALTLAGTVAIVLFGTVRARRRAAQEITGTHHGI